MSSPTVETLHRSPSPSSPTPEDRARRRAARRRQRLLIWVPVLSLTILAGGYFGWLYFKGSQAPFNGPTYPATIQRLQISIVERGTLESAENSDIVCKVKAGKKGTSGIIKWVIDDGTEVEKGQKLLEIEDSALKEDLNDQINKVNKAKADWISSKENYSITESQNFSDIETAKTTQTLAEITLKKFLGERIAAKIFPIATRPDLQRYLLTSHVDNAVLATGCVLAPARFSLPQALWSGVQSSVLENDLNHQLKDSGGKSISDILQMLSDIGGRIELARSDREMALDRAAWSKRMLEKKYLSRSQVEADKSKLDSYEFTLKKTQVEYDLYRKYTIEQNVTDLWSKVKEADRVLDRVKSQARAKLTTAQADLDSKYALYMQELDRKSDIEEEIAKCVIFSPQEGLVVYYVPEQSRFGSGSQQSIVAQGEPVREGQKLMRIPNLSRMLVNTRVHEAMVSKLKGEINRPTGFSDTLRAAFSVKRPGFELAINHLAYNEVLRDQFRDKESETLYPGQKAFIKIDAYPSKVFQGRVKTVATVASQADWMSSDVKVYQTMVSIDDTVSNLKPGMSAEVTILASESTEPLLTIPIQSVAGSIAMGAKRKCFVVEGGQPREREIVVGRSNDKHVEVTEGLKEGDNVVLNPRPLLGEKSGMKAGTPATRRGVDPDEMSGTVGAGKKAAKKGAVPPGGAPGGAAIPGASGKQFNRPEGAPVLPKKP